jgi:hypothetical protein
MQTSFILNRTIVICLTTSWLPPLQHTLAITMAGLLQLLVFDIQMWSTYYRRLIMDMERFSHLLWANLTSLHFSLFLHFTPLYTFLIYGVFFNKALHDFERIWLSSIHAQIQTTTNIAKFSLSNQWIEKINLICQQNIFSQICYRLLLFLRLHHLDGINTCGYGTHVSLE